MTARSVDASRPTIVAFAVSPLLKVTVMVPPSAAAEITWLLVRIEPFDVMITPDPSSEPPLAATWIETTLGITAAATLASVSVGLVPPLTTVPLAMGVVLPPSRCRAISAPASPEPSATTSTSAPTPAIRPNPWPEPERSAGGGAAGSAGGYGGSTRVVSLTSSGLGSGGRDHQGCGSYGGVGWARGQGSCRRSWEHPRAHA